MSLVYPPAEKKTLPHPCLLRNNSEILSESSSPLDQSTRNLASLLASKVYFHLGEFEEALAFALGAGDAFDVNVADDFTESVVSKAIDSYIEQNSAAFAAQAAGAGGSQTVSAPAPDVRLVKIVDSMFTRCMNAGEYKPAIGIALETRRLDTIKAIFEHTGRRDHELLSYTLEAVMGIGGVGVLFRQQVSLYSKARDLASRRHPETRATHLRITVHPYRSYAFSSNFFSRFLTRTTSP